MLIFQGFTVPQFNLLPFCFESPIRSTFSLKLHVSGRLGEGVLRNGSARLTVNPTSGLYPQLKKNKILGICKIFANPVCHGINYRHEFLFFLGSNESTYWCLVLSHRFTRGGTPDPGAPDVWSLVGLKPQLV